MLYTNILPKEGMYRGYSTSLVSFSPKQWSYPFQPFFKDMFLVEFQIFSASHTLGLRVFTAQLLSLYSCVPLCKVHLPWAPCLSSISILSLMPSRHRSPVLTTWQAFFHLYSMCKYAQIIAYTHRILVLISVLVSQGCLNKSLQTEQLKTEIYSFRVQKARSLKSKLWQDYFLLEL